MNRRNSSLICFVGRMRMCVTSILTCTALAPCRCTHKDCARRIPVLEPVTDEAAGEPVDKEAELTQDVEETQPPPAAAANTLVKAPRTLHTLTREEAEDLETQTKELAKSIRAMKDLTSKDDFLNKLLEEHRLVEFQIPGSGRCQFVAVLAGLMLANAYEIAENPLITLRLQPLLSLLRGEGLPEVKRSSGTTTWGEKQFHTPHILACLNKLRSAAVESVEAMKDSLLLESGGDTDHASLDMDTIGDFAQRVFILDAEERAEQKSGRARRPGRLEKDNVAGCDSACTIARCSLQRFPRSVVV